MKYLMLLALLLLIPISVHTQSRDQGCGSLPNPEGYLRGFTRYFVDEDYAEVRGAEIERVSDSDTRQVVTEPQVCSRVLRKALTVLREDDSEGFQELRRNGFRFGVFQYGPYYTVYVQENTNDPPGVVTMGLNPLFVLRASDMEYVATIIT
jgi:hypothetical protein